ncbi:MAG: leucine--tRNA ligase, partial [Candidatus Parcubacteria bacterium]|nr:leucine--tRNA ligase [Candidatus Parcubacteria bacterium]
KMERERISDLKEKTGVELKGISAINPCNGREIPVFVADYVLMNYGLGAVMAVPAHDQRDFDFAKKHNLPIIETIKQENQSVQLQEKAYEGEGVLVDSGRFDGLKSEIAKERIGEWLNQQGLAKKNVFYKLRDWTISRQRYWGSPIPMVFCKNCGWQAVKEKDLPVLLPEIKNYNPPGDGKSPLARSEEFVNTDCPKCKKLAIRETDTMDTFVCSSWYFLRYTDPRNEKAFASKEKMRLWLPVDMYIGGLEHAVMHLLYARFFTKALKKFGYLHFNEPFSKVRHQGIILGPDRQKMSKSRGNVINPDEQIKKYGSDIVRMFLFFMGPFSQGGPWNPGGIEGIVRFSAKLWALLGKKRNESTDKGVDNLINLTIKKVSEDIENLRFNTAISSLMILVNNLQEKEYISTRNLKTISLLIAPLAPHLAEEMWQEINGKIKQAEFEIKDSIHSWSWPEYNPRMIEKENIRLIIQVNGRVRDMAETDKNISESAAKELAFSREKIKHWIEGKDIKKVIFIKGKLINIVI